METFVSFECEIGYCSETVFRSIRFLWERVIGGGMILLFGFEFWKWVIFTYTDVCVRLTLRRLQLSDQLAIKMTVFCSGFFLVVCSG